MSRLVDIPGGQATLRDTGEVKQRHRQRLERASVLSAPALAKINAVRDPDEDPRALDMAKVGLTGDEFDTLYEMQDATILAYLAGWTLDRPLPRSAEELGELPADLYDALRTATAPDGANTIAPVDFQETPDRERPTGQSSGSDGSSKDGQESEAIIQSTESQPSDGGSSATGV